MGYELIIQNPCPPEAEDGTQNIIDTLAQVPEKYLAFVSEKATELKADGLSQCCVIMRKSSDSHESTSVYGISLHKDSDVIGYVPFEKHVPLTGRRFAAADVTRASRTRIALEKLMFTAEPRYIPGNPNVEVDRKIVSWYVPGRAVEILKN